MAENSKIEWCDHTFNPWIGCTKVSAGCQHCYAEQMMDKRWGKVEWGPQGRRIRTSPANWRKPLAWNKQAEKEGRRFRVFCASLADVFEGKPDQPEMDDWRRELFQMIIDTPHLDWLLLTKRPENVCRIIERVTGFSDAEMWFHAAQNVQIGTSVENQDQADIRIPELLRIPAAVRFLSMEPLLAPVDLTRIATYQFSGSEIVDPLNGELFDFLGEQVWITRPLIHWVIVGGESGPNARPMHPDWARDIRDQCVEAGVPFFFKQWGEYYPNGQMTGVDWRLEKPDASISVTTIPHDNGRVDFWRVGKKSAGRLLDGVEWNQFPQLDQNGQSVDNLAR